MTLPSEATALPPPKKKRTFPKFFKRYILDTLAQRGYRSLLEPIFYVNFFIFIFYFLRKF